MYRKILISGTSSGLGKYLSKKFNCTKLKRNKISKKILNTEWDLIIHCAFNSKTFGLNKEFISYYNDNVVLTNFISSLKGKKIFFSSCAVYDHIKKRENKNENYFIDITKIKNTYARTKLICESFFNKEKDIIIRLGSIIGHEIRKNSNIYNMLNKTKPKLKLTKKSKFSFVSYEEIFIFLNIILKKKKFGIYNFLRTDYTSLYKIADILNLKNIRYGKINFNVSSAQNSNIKNIMDLKHNSIEILKKFIKK